MDNISLILLDLKLKSQKKATISLHGSSMYPTLKDQSVVLIKKNLYYRRGDIVLFEYNNNLLVHRLLKITKKYYYIKGDNAFRIEKIKKNQVFGKVHGVYTNNILEKIKKCDKKFLELSLQINKIFIENKENIELTMNSSLYKKYAETYL